MFLIEFSTPECLLGNTHHFFNLSQIYKDNIFWFTFIPDIQEDLKSCSNKIDWKLLYWWISYKHCNVTPFPNLKFNINHVGYWRSRTRVGFGPRVSSLLLYLNLESGASCSTRICSRQHLREFSTTGYHLHSPHTYPPPIKCQVIPVYIFLEPGMELRN
jgi:hypothetical protein